MTSIGLVETAIALMALSGLPAFLFPRSSRAGQRAGTVLLLAGSLLGLAGLAASLAAGAARAYKADWFLPWGEFSVAVDGLGAMFLALVFVIPALGSVYGLEYWRQSEHADNGRRLGLSYGLLAASMAQVVLARDGVLFLISWEIMALSAWLASTTESDKPEVRRAGWIYLVATHIGTLCLLAMFALWRSATGSFALVGAAAVDAEAAGAIFALALVGFGLKAGIMPLHVWLPGAHANAPSHVSAVMSGVMLKIGVYGILRMTSLLPLPETWWGWTLLGLGALTGLAGIAWAMGQGDLKRLLAYSSIENIGIITMGVGLALLGRSSGRADLVVLGMGGALLHVWNHGLFKSLLFLDAGAVMHATHTRKLDALGGLAKTMPRAAGLFALGAVAISALPPLNGFVGEWLLYIGFFRVVGTIPEPSLAAAAAGAAVLATIGALAVAVFVRAFGVVFLGSARRAAGGHAPGDPGPAMVLPMAFLALACLAVGLFPGPALSFAAKTALDWGGLEATGLSLSVFANTSWLTTAGFALIILIVMLFLFFRLRSGAGTRPEIPTWDCGYAAPTPRMQYTASSVGEFLIRGLAFVLFPKRRNPLVTEAFPRPSSFSSKLPDLVLDRLLAPLARFAARLVPGVKVLQQGQTQLYLVYVLVVTVILLVVGVGLS